MKDENQSASDEKRNKSILVAMEKLAALDEDELEKLAGGSVGEVGTAPTGCTCQNQSCTSPG